MIHLLKTHKVNLSLIVILLTVIVFSFSLDQAFATQTALSSWVADDPDDLDAIFSAGDTLTITFADNTNQTLGLISQAAIDGNFTFGATIETDSVYTGNWIDAANLRITIVTANTAPVLTTTVVTAKAGNTIGIAGEGAGADSTHTLNPATTTSALTGDFGLFVAAITGKDGSSGCRGDCSAPTLGVDEQFSRVVENGFTYNGNQINVERYFTPYPLITVDVGKQNTAVFKIYENSGPDNIQHFDFAFGLDIGQVMGTSNAMISWDRSHDGTETVTVVDPNNALENVRVPTSEGKCKADSTTNDCLIISVSHTFREPLDFDIVGTNVWDYRQHSWQNFYNHGIHIEGESLNPPDEYVGYCHNILCSSIKGNLIHLIETGKNTAVDEQGNTWTFDNTWIQDYVSKGKIEDPITSQGYDRDHVKFNAIKQEQELAAYSLFEKYYKTSVSHEQSFAEIDDIKFYEYPETVDKKFDPVLLAKMHKEDIRAQKYLEEMFAKMYPGKVFD